jgi:hypothetical protein
MTEETAVIGETRCSGVDRPCAVPSPTRALDRAPQINGPDPKNMRRNYARLSSKPSNVCNLNCMRVTLKPLDGKLVVLIEEDPSLAEHIGGGLTDAGAQIIGPARTVAEAKALLLRLRTGPLAAVVSMGLFDAEGGTVSNCLTRLAAPVLLIRKTECRLLLPSMRHVVMTVPFAAQQVVSHIVSLQEAGPVARPRERTGPVLLGH